MDNAQHRKTESMQPSVKRVLWTPELVARFWAGIAQTRLTEYDFAKQAGKSVIVAVEHHLPKAGRILDFGAGNGELVELLLERGYQVAAYEPSTGRTAEWLARLDARPGFLGVVRPESEEQFDVVLMTEVIEHVLDEELDRTLRHIYKLLNESGVLIITTPNNEDLELGMAYCPISNALFHRWQHVRSFTADSLSKLLSRYGIISLAVHLVELRPDLYERYDPHWGGDQFVPEVPSHLRAIRGDIPVHHGSESNLIYIGRKGTTAS
jgi:2-polyprenyl-3-methyl-5-hydroxy-6-metoxy-1,4-benzoquinol methylase